MIKRTFIAIKINPTEELLRRIYYLQNNLKNENINWIKEDRFHITLRFIGNTPVKKISDVVEMIEKKVSDLYTFNIIIKGISVFGSYYNPRVIWAGVEPIQILKEVVQKLDSGLNNLGFSMDRQNFVPHLSIARIRKIKDKNYFQKVIDNIDDNVLHSELVESFVLYESLLEQRGAVYKVIKEIKLRQ